MTDAKSIDAISLIMSDNVADAKSIYDLCKRQGLLDSQEFIDWQDELNKISVQYK